MPHPAALAAFLAASLALLLIPGPAVLLVVGRSLASGRRAGLGTVPSSHLAAPAGWPLGGSGLGGLVRHGLRRRAARRRRLSHPARHQAPALGRGSRGAGGPAAARGIHAFTVAALNPKTAVFFLAFLPQFVDPSGSAPLQTLVFGVLFVALGVLTNLGWVFVCGLAGRALRGTRARRWRRLGGGGLLIGLGVLTAATGGRHR